MRNFATNVLRARHDMLNDSNSAIRLVASNLFQEIDPEALERGGR